MTKEPEKSVIYTIDPTLHDRLRGTYRIAITDGLGPAGGEEPDNPDEFVRTFPTSPIQIEAAYALLASQILIADLVDVLENPVRSDDGLYDYEQDVIDAALAKAKAMKGDE